jgi:hypothetical protein
MDQEIIFNELLKKKERKKEKLLYNLNFPPLLMLNTLYYCNFHFKNLNIYNTTLLLLLLLLLNRFIM